MPMTESTVTTTVSRAQVWSFLLGGAAILSALAWFFWPQQIALVSLRLWLPLWVVTVFVYGFSNTDRPIAWLRKWLRYTRLEMFKIGGGYYAAVAAALFITMEVQRLLVSVDVFFASKTNWLSALFQQCISFSVDSVMNGIYVVAWPGFLTKTIGFHSAWWAIGPAFALYWLALKVVRVDESKVQKHDAEDYNQ
jgi:hypothetical protein